MTHPSQLQEVDASTVSRIAEGDRDALAVLVDELGGAAYSLALRICVEAPVAEEAVQDAFLTVWREAGRYEPRTASVTSWVLGLVRHKAIDRVRHEQRRRPRGEDGAPAATVDAETVDIVDTGSGSADPFAAAWVSMRSREVGAALAELSAEHREVLELGYFGGLSQREIAQEICVPVGTVKTRTLRALTRLRDVLEARGLERGDS